ncbi:histidine kinase dimerization/phosphoacceptor domain -containing protein [uncultured Methanobrevibacter sp.]|uniref:histidine kinase dimerization/phosphoacceptor domain -containing protein n=1 Tax=uncultured Methanobrevibacter sp. TaxID=253161 RepID=UPI0025F56312|nr:histidine kinase dimerization/phosphoacceptor domain -containing protein [uncultured Methanobrevibacter sp.]
MRIEKEYRIFEDIEEVRIFNATKKDFYKPTPKEFDVEDMPFQELINNVSTEIHSFIPYENGKDFIIQRLGTFTLNKYNSKPKDAMGRRLSKISPLFFDILHEYFLEVYENHTPKKIRFVYYNGKKLTKLSTAKIVFDMDRIFVVTNNVDTATNRRVDADYRTFDEDKTNMMENFSQTGSYYKVHGKYVWSQGVYNIINRAKEDSDDFYNIVFDLVIPEDQHIVDKIFYLTNNETSQCEEVIRIRTDNGVMKVIEVNVYSYFDDSGIIIRQGLINDITQRSDYGLSKPVDFLMDGFKNSKKLALLIEPLSKKQYEFSKGFYYMIEKDYGDYNHSRKIMKNIVEKDVVKNLNKLINGELDKIDEVLTFKVDGNSNNKKIVDLYIERFNYNNEVHSLGFLTDVTEDIEKQDKLVASNEQKVVLIKEIHHRVKNNLQVLNSFLNLEKRAYKNDPDLIIEHMQTRLTSLALLHEKTYGTKDFVNINLKDYLVDHDMKTEGFMELPSQVEFETIVDEDLNLSIEVITPLLLIIDELTMNAIKHAFPDKTATDNKITKQITKLNEGDARLIIKDNGVGILDSKSISKNLGCEIIKSLTSQLGGKISLIECEKGTAYELIFPIRMDHTIN